MKKEMMFLLVVIAIFIVGCETQDQPLPEPFEPEIEVENEIIEISEIDSQKIATKYIEENDEYAHLSGRNLRYRGSEILKCPYCWNFNYSFIRLSPENNVSQRMDAVITVNSGKIIAASFEERK